MIDLNNRLSFKNAFHFPLQNRDARREVLIGALLLLVPFVGWLMNMGHRILVVHKMQHGIYPWPSWNEWQATLKHGLITWLGMLYYYLPAILSAGIGLQLESTLAVVLGAVLFVLATIAIPGYMSHYCKAFDVTEIFNPFKALRRSLQGGRGYWKSWSIALSALALSALGLLAFGVGFLISSVWFWQVAGYSFANTFARVYHLQEAPVPQRQVTLERPIV